MSATGLTRERVQRTLLSVGEKMSVSEISKKMMGVCACRSEGIGAVIIPGAQSTTLR